MCARHMHVPVYDTYMYTRVVEWLMRVIGCLLWLDEGDIQVEKGA